MLHGQFTGLVEQTVSHFLVSITSSMLSQAKDSDMDYDSEPSSPNRATDEDELSDWESAKPEDCDQEISEEHT